MCEFPHLVVIDYTPLLRIPHLFPLHFLIFAAKLSTITLSMNLTVFLDETPQWVVVPLGLIYVAVMGYFVYIGIRMFRE